MGLKSRPEQPRFLSRRYCYNTPKYVLRLDVLKQYQAVPRIEANKLIIPNKFELV